MFNLTCQLYASVLDSVSKHGFFDKRDILNETYNTAWKYNPWHNNFQLIEYELDRSIRFGGMKYICDSTDVYDLMECGDYSYYTSFLSHDIPMLYIQASHIWHSPSYVKIYGNDITVEICTAKTSIDVYNTNESIKNIYMYMDRNCMIDLLRNTDRETLYNI